MSTDTTFVDSSLPAISADWLNNLNNFINGRATSTTASFQGGVNYVKQTFGYEAKIEPTLDSFANVDPTGVAECALAINAAIAAASALGVKAIRMPGIYKTATVVNFLTGLRYEITGRFNFSGSQEKGISIAASSSDITIEGFGQGKLTGDVSNSLFVGTGCSNIRLYGMDISGSVLVGTGHSAGFWCDGSVDGLDVDRCYFHGNGRGVITDGSGDNLDLVVYVNGGSNNKNVHLGNSNRFVSTAVSYNVILYNVQDFSVGSSVFSGAVCEVGSTNKGYGLAIYATVKGNVLRGSVNGPIVYNTQGCAIYLADVQSVTVNSPICSNVATVQSDVSLPVGGVAVNGGLDVCVSNAVVNGSGRDGVVLNADPTLPGVDLRLNVVGGSANNCAQSGFRLRGALDHASFTGVAASDCDRGFLADTAVKDLTLIGDFSFAKPGSTGAGVDLVSVTNSKIDVNCHKNARHGMLVRAGSHNRITGTFTDNSTESLNTYDGVFNAATNTSFIGVVSGNTGATGQRYGLNSTGDYCNIRDCDLTRNQTGGYNLNTSLGVGRSGNRLSVDATPGDMQGTATFSAGTVTITTNEVLGTDQIVYGALGATGAIRTSTITSGTSFVATSSNGADSGSFTWAIVH